MCVVRTAAWGCRSIEADGCVYACTVWHRSMRFADVVRSVDLQAFCTLLCGRWSVIIIGYGPTHIRGAIMIFGLTQRHNLMQAGWGRSGTPSRGGWRSPWPWLRRGSSSCKGTGIRNRCV